MEKTTKGLRICLFTLQATGTVERRRSALLWSSSYHIRQGTGAYAIGATTLTRDSIGDEKTGSDVVLVARVGWRDRKSCSFMYAMCTSSSDAALSGAYQLARNSNEVECGAASVTTGGAVKLKNSRTQERCSRSFCNGTNISSSRGGFPNSSSLTKIYPTTKTHVNTQSLKEMEKR
ncbi:uncharacterized protein LOC119167749 isoform X1 [Rhipicephalus microplus]|uniref:uncharacterized protein LOC119167749 isoform X1 n=1 Tax=Rhipicephalus microplus TaxID=6941 RepID=UPI003F6B1129